MARTLDEIDVLLLDELQRDADRPNVELARLAGLSPAATLNRIRRLKESGVLAGIHAKVDEAAAGFGLHVYISVTLGHHEEALERRFEKVLNELPQVTAAAWVAGETDALLTGRRARPRRTAAGARRALDEGGRAAGRHPAAAARDQARQPAPAR